MSPRGYLMKRRQRFPLDGRLHRLHWYHGDRFWHLTWLWRPLCWLDGGHSDDSYGSCVICHKSLGADL